MDKIQELIKKAENKVNSTMLSNIRKTEINLILLEIQKEAINYTRCCEELKAVGIESVADMVDPFWADGSEDMKT
jgi:hypothetical protein